MNEKDFYSLFITVFGALCALAFFAAIPLVLLYFGPQLFDRGRVDGAAESDRKSAESAREKQEREARIQALGLYERYEVVPFLGDLPDLLYEQRDFEAVDARLSALFEKRSDPFAGHVYSRSATRLTVFEGPGLPEDRMAVLDAWVATSPSSYRARMLRGMLYMRIGWYVRGGGYWDTVSRDSRRRFESSFDLARADLEAAHALYPDDAEIPVNLGSIARGLGESEGDYYDRALAISPLSISAQIARMQGALPKWGGSWEQVDAILADCEALSQEFPLIMIVKREAEREMALRSAAHKAALETPEKMREWADPYLRQLQLNPDDPRLKASAAYYAAEGRDFALAERLFRELGDRYYTDGAFKDLLEYNDMRGNAYAGVAHGIEAGPERYARAVEAVELAPNHYYTNYFFGTQLLDKGENERAKKHFAIARDARPKFTWSICRLAEVSERLNQREEAVRFAREALALNPNDEQRAMAQGIISRNE